MKYFTSDLSQKKFPVTEKVLGSTIRGSVLSEVLKEHPDFNESKVLSLAELNYYRQRYIQNLLTREVGTLTDLEHTVLQNISQDHLISDDARNLTTRGQRWADRIASFGGSWKFIGIFGVFLVGWMIINVIMLQGKGFDPYPFILLNLILSCIAAIQAPVIMMSQNRQEEKDRERAKNDYMVNLKSEIEIRMLHEKIDHLIVTQQENLLEIQQIQVDMMKEIIEKFNTMGGRTQQ